MTGWWNGGGGLSEGEKLLRATQEGQSFMAPHNFLCPERIWHIKDASIEYGNKLDKPDYEN